MSRNVLALVALATALAQPPGFGGPPGGGFGGPGRGGPGGFSETTKVLKQFDKDNDQKLNAEERKAAREWLASQPRRGRGRGGFPGRGRTMEPGTPGPKVTPGEVKNYGAESLYDTGIIRTLFLDFENPEWEAELADFNNTDVEVPARLTVDGKRYEGIGVHFRGASSFMMVPAGRKRSLNLSIDFTDKKARLNGYRTLNLLNAHGDPSFLRSLLYLDIARQYTPAPKANLVRVVINGELWGIYTNAQQFNSDFTKENFGSSEGARWKAPGSPFGRAGLSYLGDDPEAYKKIYDIKTKDTPKSWTALIALTKTLTQTPPDKLEAALAPMFDIDGALKFLAVEKALINSDGYWVRSSDYSLYLDPKGIFHVIPHDANETLQPPEGPGSQGAGIEVDPFAGSGEQSRVLLSKLLAVPALRAKYLGYMKDVAEKWLDWKRLGPLAEKYHALIAADVARDTRKLYSTQAFKDSLTIDHEEEFRGPGSTPGLSLKSFADQRRAYLLKVLKK